MALVKDILRTMDYGPSPESSDAVRAWLATREAGFGCFIGGRFTPAHDLFDVFDPATGARIGRATQGSAADVDAAVAAARKALPRWAALSGHERARFLYALARHVQKRERFLAVLETIDNGKPIRESRDIDVPLVARHFYHHAGWAALIDSEFPGTKPVGVCGQIIPWNFPLLMLAWKIAPALAAGCTVVLKPAEYTPLTALAFAEICIEAGLPAGVVNIVTGDGDAGAALAAHEGVDKVAFTGSTEVGRAIRKATAGTGKALTLELGGKSPFVVFDDADLDSAVEGVVDAIWFNQGQVCCAGSRLLAAEGIAEALHARLRARMAKLRVGDPLDKSTDVGAIVAPVQLERIERLMRAGAEEGLAIWRADERLPAKGSFYPPTLVTGVEPASILMREEIFGPVLVTTTFRTPDEAVALANNTRYGLAASVWTENVNRALDVAARIKAGVVWINATNLFDAASGFGGYRESGFGREGGREGFCAYRVADVAGGKPYGAKTSAPSALPGATPAGEGGIGIDRTAKLYVGGKQARPDSGASYAVLDPRGRAVGLAGLGSRKDIRNAVEAAAKASSWAAATAHTRAQVLYYVAENLAARADEFANRLSAMTGAAPRAAAAEVDASIRRAFFYAGFADKYDGAVHATRSKFVTLAMNEPWGVMGIVCPDEAPLLALVSLVMPAVAMGNCVVAVPSTRHPFAATDFYSVLDTSDVPGGVVNIVTGEANALALTLAEHDGVDAVWYVGDPAGAAKVEAASAGNLKATWTQATLVDWPRAEGRPFLRRATQ
ncbi:aldehyde dehydrogenase (NAD+), partial [Roseiarcus fermentans]